MKLQEVVGDLSTTMASILNVACHSSQLATTVNEKLDSLDVRLEQTCAQVRSIGALALYPENTL